MPGADCRGTCAAAGRIIRNYIRKQQALRFKIAKLVDFVSYRYDSMEYEDMTAKQMYTQLKERLSKNGRTYLFLDEVQEIKGWEKVVNSLASDFDVDLYVTGSNSHMMSSEISTYLTGRYICCKIHL